MSKVPIHSYDDLRKKADEFLRTYNPTGTIPVPIEEIVEFEFDINIVSVLGLQREFEIDGFTSSDLKNIYVDEYVYTDRINRYRFTLAHEIGHILLHASVFKSQKFTSIDGWKEFTNTLPDADHRWLEYQGYAFAGLVLVPRENLIKQTEKWIKKNKRRRRISGAKLGFFVGTNHSAFGECFSGIGECHREAAGEGRDQKEIQ
jgi:hypothetical protein